MSELGVFGVHRSVWNHPLLEEEKEFSRREAWLWLVSEAAWKPRRVRIVGKIVSIKRGQVPHSIRFMADAWGWSKGKTERFLEALKTETMIETDTAHGQVIITVCNYEKYQIVGLPSGTDTETPTGTAAGQDRDSSGTNEKKENTKELKNTSSLRSEVPDARSGRKPKPTALASDWKPAEGEREYARTQGMSDQRIARTAEDFRDYWTAKPKDNTKLDWSATWRKWVRTDLERKPPDRPKPSVNECDSGNLTPEIWGQLLSTFRRFGRWNQSQYGPEPGRPGCRVPSEILSSWEASNSQTPTAA